MICPIFKKQRFHLFSEPFKSNQNDLPDCQYYLICRAKIMAAHRSLKKKYVSQLEKSAFLISVFSKKEIGLRMLLKWNQ